MPNIPHKFVAGVLVGALGAAMLLSAISQRWGTPYAALMGDVGILPFAAAALTVGFLAIRSAMDSRALKNTQAALEHTRRAEVATRFQKGMEMLSSENEATRIGGIYILRDVVIDSPENYWRSVVDSIWPFVLARCSDQRDFYYKLAAIEDGRGEPIDDDVSLNRTPADVVIALKLIWRADPEVRRRVSSFAASHIDMDGLVLAFVDFADIAFRSISFRGAIMEQVEFTRCTFEQLEFGAAAGSVRFIDCDLRGASLGIRSMIFNNSPVRFTECDLTGARLVPFGNSIAVRHSCVEGVTIGTGRGSIKDSWYFDAAPEARQPTRFTVEVHLAADGQIRRQSERGMEIHALSEESDDPWDF